jgi:hypothetical protein
VRLRGVMMFWPAYHDVTDSRQVAHSTVSVSDYSPFTFRCF